MRKTVLIFDDDARVRAAALQCLDLKTCRILALGSEDDPLASAGRHDAQLLVFGAMDDADEDTPSLLRLACRKPIVPLFRPSVYQRVRQAGRGLGSGLILGLSDCRVRIAQHLQAREKPPSVALQWGDFTLRLEAGDFAFRGHGLGLTRSQSAILSLLMGHAGEIVSRRMIEDAVFPGKPKSATNFVSVHISRLRAKLREHRSGILIENVKGAGYVLFWGRPFSVERLPEPRPFVVGSEIRSGLTVTSLAGCGRTIGPMTRTC